MRMLKKMYTLTIVLLPILSMYRGIGSSIDFGTICVLGLFFLNVLYTREKIVLSIPQEWGCYLVYVIMITLGVIVWDNVNGIQMISRLFKNVLYTVVLLISYENGFYISGYAKKAYTITTIYSTTYIYIQSFVARFFNRILWGYIPGLVKKISYVEDINRTTPSTFRPSSIFYEPSHYFIYVFVTLILLLFCEERCNAKRLALALFISGGIVLSTTSMGIIFVAIIWLCWVAWKSLKNYRNKRTEIMFLVVCTMGAMASLILLNSQRVINALERVFDTGYTGGNAIAGRGMGYYEIIKMPIINAIFGYGYGNVGSEYYPSMAFNFLCIGAIGCFLLFVIFYNIYIKILLKEEKISFIAYIAMCFYGEIFMSYYLLFFMSMFMYKREEYSDIGMQSEEKV